MKFKFCGDFDAPDWILAEVNVLSKFSSVRMKLLCRQVVEHILTNAINWEKIQKLTTGSRLNFEISDIKAMIAALDFIISSAAKYDCEDKVLHLELQQLGLPKDICSAICRSLRASKDKVREHLAANMMQLPRLVHTDWRVDYVVSSSVIQDVNAPMVQLNFHTNKPMHQSITSIHPRQTSTQQSVTLSADMFRVFYNELKAARALMEASS